jgi:hypothetical protein
MNGMPHIPMFPNANPLARMAPICCVLLLLSEAARVQADLAPDFLMDTDPEFHALPLVKEFKRDFKGTWLLALQRPEADYQRMAAETVARAHEHGIPDLIQLAPALEEILGAPASHPASRYAAARALIALGSRESAPRLLEAGLKYGISWLMTRERAPSSIVCARCECCPVIRRIARSASCWNWPVNPILR